MDECLTSREIVQRENIKTRAGQGYMKPESQSHIWKESQLSSRLEIKWNGGGVSNPGNMCERNVWVRRKKRYGNMAVSKQAQAGPSTFHLQPLPCKKCLWMSSYYHMKKKQLKSLDQTLMPHVYVVPYTHFFVQCMWFSAKRVNFSISKTHSL